MDTPLAPLPVPPAPPSPAVQPVLATAWPRSAQMAVAFLLGIIATLIGVQAWGSLRWSSRPTDLERQPLLAYRVDLNRADRAELLQIPGVGPALAERIVDRRPYEHPHQLREVPGIGPTIYERLRPWVYVAEEETADEEAPPASVKKGRASMAADSGSGKKKDLKGPLDVNRATVEQLQQLPGIGPVMAKAIVAEREKRPFKSVDDLRRVPRIGPKTVEQLRPHVLVGSDPNSVVAAE